MDDMQMYYLRLYLGQFTCITLYRMTYCVQNKFDWLNASTMIIHNPVRMCLKITTAAFLSLNQALREYVQLTHFSKMKEEQWLRGWVFSRSKPTTWTECKCMPFYMQAMNEIFRMMIWSINHVLSSNELVRALTQLNSLVLVINTEQTSLKQYQQIILIFTEQGYDLQKKRKVNQTWWKQEMSALNYKININVNKTKR